MRKIKFSTEDILINLFKFMWIFILLPKTLQFACYLLILLLILWKNKVVFSKTTLFLLLGCCIQLVAILRQMFIVNPSTTRIFAAFNTLGIGVLSILMYSVASKLEPDDERINKIAHYMRINIAILVGIYFVSLVIRSNTVSFLGQKFYFKRMDYLASGVTTRFCACMETVLGPGHFFFIASPVLLLDSSRGDKRNALRNIIFILLTGWMVVETHSRIGLLCCGAAMLFIIGDYLGKYMKREQRIVILACAAVIALFLLYRYRRYLMFELSSFFNARGGSNEARFNIYRKSLEKMLIESPILGIGIKYMLGSFPYGSHSTYIGLLYKAGFLGTFMYLIGIFRLFGNFTYSSRKLISSNTALITMLFYAVFLIFADLDASNWVIVSMFTLLGLVNSSVFEKPVRKEETIWHPVREKNLLRTA